MKIKLVDPVPTLWYDPIIGEYAYTCHELMSLRHTAMMKAYLSATGFYRLHRKEVLMRCDVNNKRRFEGLKPLRKRTWKRLKGS